MPAGTKALQGIFKEMLEDYLRVTTKDVSKEAAKAVKLVTKDGAKQVEKDASKIVMKGVKGEEAETLRQLMRQVDGMRGIPREELIKRLEHPLERGGKAQDAARKEARKVMQQLQDKKVLSMTDKQISQEMADRGLAMTGDAVADAKSLAKARTQQFMDGVNALHEPDLVAGGQDVIGAGGRSMGTGSVNQYIGGQWGPGGAAHRLRDALVGPPPREIDDITFLIVH